MMWEKVKIGDIYEGLYDGPHATPPTSDDGAIFLGISNITKDGHIDLSDIKHINENDLPKWTKRVTPKGGDIVFSYEATLNLYAIIPDDFWGCLGRRMALIRPDETKAHGKYLYYYFFSEEWRSTVSSHIITGATVDRIPIAKFPEFIISLPPMEKQHKIANILSNYDDLIVNNKKQIKLLEEAAQRLYKEWFVNLHFPGYEDVEIVAGVPEGWKYKRVDEFGKVITGKTPSTSKSEYYGGSIPFVTIPDMHGKVFPLVTEKTLTKTGADTQKNKYLPINSVIVSCIATVGLVNIAVEPCQTNQQINSVILYDDSNLYFFYESMKRIKTLLDGVGSNGATMTNVNKTKFSNISVLYPTEDLVKRYNAFCKPIFNKILGLSKGILVSKQARDRLLPKLMSGEIEV
ncbi:restriction endonuclease subunit S [uncultured Megasphaera sp.]|uniref:restriction endonuclease subunit S n=1 Tax=uncultured Megasphaera sp. TaxID=165188 RepID=UPI00288BAE26|nr:restriction endonuclease subunit S [uncultured Megasphaera sp.]